MPYPSETIQKKIVEYATSSKPTEMVSYLKEELVQNRTNPQEIYDYASHYQFQNYQKTYVINASIINCLGVVVGNLQSPLNTLFYKLAADRGSSWGFINYIALAPAETDKEAFAQSMLPRITGKASEDYYAKAMCYEFLGQEKEAMLAYCAISDEKFEKYQNVVVARARLLKKQVSLNMANSKSELPAKVPSIPFLMPNGIPFIANFSVHWTKRTAHFDSANADKIEQTFEARNKKLDKLIAARNIEIGIINEFLQISSEDNQFAKDHKKGLEKELEQLKELQEKLIKKHNQYTPKRRQMFRRHAAERVYFDRHCSKKDTTVKELTYALIEQRFQLANTEPKPLAIDLTNKSTRSLISAESAFQQAATSLTGMDNPNLGIPTLRKQPWSYESGVSGDNCYGPIEHYKIEETIVKAEHRVNPKRNRLGDSYLPEGGTYNGQIGPFLHKLGNKDKEKEKQLATYMIRYGKSHQAVSLEELQTVYPAATQDDVHHFTRICFLILEKEQSQWQSAIHERFQLGMAVSQARCLLLIKAGFLSFEDVFYNNVLFGAYSATNINNDPEKVAGFCANIDAMYLRYLQTKQGNDYVGFFKEEIKENKTVCILTRQQAHLDLMNVYGGASDTESEDGYESDLSI